MTTSESSPRAQSGSSQLPRETLMWGALAPADA